MRILLDHDGVLADLHTGWLHLHNLDNPGDTIHPDQVTRWAIHEFVRIGHRIYDYLHRVDLYHHVPVIPGSREGVQALLDAGHELILLTAAANKGAMIDSKITWLRKEFPMLDPRNFVFTDNKGIFKADLMLDDGPHNLEVFDGLQLMMDAPHNHDEQRFIRVKDWTEVLSFCTRAGILGE